LRFNDTPNAIGCIYIYAYAYIQRAALATTRCRTHHWRMSIDIYISIHIYIYAYAYIQRAAPATTRCRTNHWRTSIDKYVYQYIFTYMQRVYTKSFTCDNTLSHTSLAYVYRYRYINTYLHICTRIYSKSCACDNTLSHTSLAYVYMCLCV